MCLPLLYRAHIRTKGNEFTIESRITLASCFHENLATVAHDLRQRGDSFTPARNRSHELPRALS